MPGLIRRLLGCVVLSAAVLSSAVAAERAVLRVGILQFGTELVAAQDGSIAALLGASPGASVTVSIMLDLIQRCFGEQLKTEQWSRKLNEIFPAQGAVLAKDAERYREVQSRSDALLQLEETVSA